MADTLFQSDFRFNKKWFKINPDGLLVKSKSINRTSQLLIKFEDLGINEVTSKRGKKRWLIASIVFLLFSGGMFFFERTGGDSDKNAYEIYLIFSLISGVVYFLTFKNSFYLIDNGEGNAVEFLTDKPSREILRDFIDTLKTERKKVMIAKYGQLTNMLSFEQQKNTLDWLHSEGVLSTEEYKLKVEELNGLFRKSKPIIGFSTHSD